MLTAQPYRPIPSSEVPDDAERRYFAIRPVVLEMTTRWGETRKWATESSRILFSLLKEAAHDGHTITALSQGDCDCDAGSLAALNSYLRTARIGRLGLPWERLPNAGLHRWAWWNFCEHLDLNFR